MTLILVLIGQVAESDAFESTGLGLSTLVPQSLKVKGLPDDLMLPIYKFMI